MTTYDSTKAAENCPAITPTTDSEGDTIDDEKMEMIIDRLARIETKQDESFRRQDETFKAIKDIRDNCRVCESDNDQATTRIAKIEQTLYGDNGCGLVKRTEKVEENVQGILIKMAAIGGAASLIVMGGWGFISKIFQQP